jgi:biotin carboxyl carrier protein
LTLEAAQDVERPRHHLDHITLACEIAGEHSLLAKPFRAPSHVSGSIPPCGIKFHLQNKLPQAICRHNKKPFARTPVRQTVPGRTAMPDIKIVTEVAGRVCALPVTTGGNVGDGDEIAFVEAMKMEIPVTSTTAGRIKAILVKLDDVIAEGQVVAIIEA